MARQLRPNPNGWFHVMNLGSRRWNVFLDDHDRRMFLQLVERATERFDVQVIAFALMGNHYHLVLHCKEPMLSEVMHWLGMRYVRLFNRRHEFDGALFRSRFHSVEITSNEQLLTTVRYVHRNPLDLDADRDLASYPWSSYGSYLGWYPTPDWLAKDVVLDQFATSRNYQSFVETSLPSDKVHATRASTRPTETASHTRPALPTTDGASLADAQRAVAQVAGLHVRNIQWPAGTAAKTARRAALLLCADELLLQPKQLTDALGFASPGAVSTALCRARKLLATDKAFATLVDQSRQRLRTQGAKM